MNHVDPSHALRLLRRLAPPSLLLASVLLWTAAAAAMQLVEDAPAALDGDFVSAIVVDVPTGEVLAAKQPHLRREPASMAKMMTELIVLERAAQGDISLQDEVTVSAHASRIGGSQVYLADGEVFRIEELLEALAIHSANDAAVALAEHVAGSVPAFVDLMNIRAQELGMNDTEFHSVHGLPPGRGQQPDMTSAYDMALLGLALVRHPEALRWSSQATAPFRDGEFTLYNPNKLVGKFRGLDGLKTGYHREAGYCVTATAVQRNRRLLSVVMGCSSDKARATETTRLLAYGFNLFRPQTLIEAGRTVLPEKLSISGGKKGEVAVAVDGPLVVSVRRDRSDQVEVQMRLLDDIQAPIQEGQVVGQAVAVLGDRDLSEAPIVAVESVARGSWWDRLLRR